MVALDDFIKELDGALDDAAVALGDKYKKNPEKYERLVQSMSVFYDYFLTCQGCNAEIDVVLVNNKDLEINIRIKSNDIIFDDKDSKAYKAIEAAKEFKVINDLEGSIVSCFNLPGIWDEVMDE